MRIRSVNPNCRGGERNPCYVSAVCRNLRHHKAIASKFREINSRAIGSDQELGNSVVRHRNIAGNLGWWQRA
jgi:hypothetical protein